MSHLIEKLNLVSKGISQPMGFRAAHASGTRPQMLLIASLTKPASINSPVDFTAGADAVLLHVAKTGPSAAVITKVVKNLPDLPWGFLLRDTGEKTIAKMVENGCDFVVFPADSKVLAADKNDKLGRILQVESSLSDGLLRATNDLPVDVLLAEGGESLNWHQMMALHRITNMLNKPVLTTVPPNVTAEELKALWEAGVDGVVVTSDQPAEKLEKLHREIGEFASSPRKRGKAEATLPHLSVMTEVAAAEEEEEEE